MASAQVAQPNFHQQFDYNHSTDAEYKQFRQEAQQHFQKYKDLSARSQQAYKAGNKQEAKQNSDAAQLEHKKFQELNNKAAEFVFVENNKDSGPNEIDLHGLFVSEAEYVVKRRFIYAIEHHESEIRAIVGKGLHSQNGVAKIKPAIEQLCQEAHLQWHEDPKNDGVVVVNLSNGSVPQTWYKDISSKTGNKPQQNQQQQTQYQPQHQMQYQPQQQQQYQPQQQEQNSNDDIVVQLLKMLCICIQKNT